MRRSEVVELMALVSAYWSSATFGPDTAVALSAWERLLSDVDGRMGCAAVDSLAADGERFPPPVGLIRKRAIDLVGAATGDGVPDVDEAWTLVMDWVSEVGFAGGPDTSWHQAVQNAVRALTWWRLCYDENQATLFAQFRDCYRPASSRAAQQEAVPPAARLVVASLAGILEERRRELDA